MAIVYSSYRRLAKLPFMLRASAPRGEMRDAVAWTALVAAGSLFACSSSSAPGDAGRSDASGDHHVKHDSGVEFGLDAADDVPPIPYEAAIPPSLGGLRVANWSATAPPVDFCLAAHGTTTWRGPALGTAGPQEAGAGGDGGAPGLTFSDAGTTGLGFPGVVGYFYMAPGQYDIRFVAAGSPNCDVPLVAPGATDLPPVPKGGLVTVALLANAGGDEDAGADTVRDAGRDAGGEGGRNAGDAGSARFMVVGFKDDTSVPPASVLGKAGCDLGTAGCIGLRFINAAPTAPLAGLCNAPPAFDLANEQTGPQVNPPACLAVFSGVAYGHASSPADTLVQPPFVDDQGYVFMSAGSFPIGFAIAGDMVPAETTLNATDALGLPLAQGPTSVTVGLLLTEVVLVASPKSLPDAGSDAGGEPFQLLQCVDNAEAPGLAGPCSVISNILSN